MDPQLQGGEAGLQRAGRRPSCALMTLVWPPPDSGGWGCSPAPPPPPPWCKVHVSPPPLSAGHPPPGDFIALGSKGQANESKTASTLLKPAPSGLPSERKRDAAAALAGASALTGLTKRPKLSSTPPLSALGRLAEAAVAEKRAISPSIKEPSVVPIEGRVSPWA